MKKLSYVSVSMEEALKEKLKYLAKQEQRSVSSQIRHLIQFYFREYESKYGPIKTKETFTQR